MELATEIQRQSAAKRDFRANTGEMTMLTTEGGSELLLPKFGEFGMDELAHRQVAAHLGIPSTFYQRLQEPTYTSILDYNVNHLFRIDPKERLVRVLDGNVRAILSNRYQRRDNAELVNSIMPILGDIPDVTFPSVEITDKRLYIKFVAPRLQGEVKKGDIVQAGGVISNSEVGLGALQIASMFYRLVCDNGAIVEIAVRKYHVGRQVDSEEATELFQDETLKLDDAAYWAKVADVVRNAVSETNFNRLLVKMKAASDSPSMPLPAEGVKELANRYQLSEHEQNSILHHLTLGGDLTRWGTLNAVTRASQDVESYDRATELEALGGTILNMGEAEWAAIGAEPVATPARRRRVAVTGDALVESIR